MISSSLRTLDGLGASGSSARMSSIAARWRRCTISMIWLSRRVRWTWRGRFTAAPLGQANFFALSEYIRLYGGMSTAVPDNGGDGENGLTRRNGETENPKVSELRFSVAPC